MRFLNQTFCLLLQLVFDLDQIRGQSPDHEESMEGISGHEADERFFKGFSVNVVEAGAVVGFNGAAAPGKAGTRKEIRFGQLQSGGIKVQYAYYLYGRLFWAINVDAIRLLHRTFYATQELWKRYAFFVFGNGATMKVAFTNQSAFNVSNRT